MNESGSLVQHGEKMDLQRVWDRKWPGERDESLLP